MNPEDHPAYSVIESHYPDTPVRAVIGSLLVCLNEVGDMMAWRPDKFYSGRIYHNGAVSGGLQDDLEEGIITQSEVDQVRALHSLVCR